MSFLLTAVVLGAALAVGLLANQWVRPYARTEVQGVKLELLVSPLLTLTVLLLSFVLVQAFASYNRVRVAESREAGRLVFEFEVAGYFPDEFARPIQAALVCYGRSVVLPVARYSACGSRRPAIQTCRRARGRR